VRVARETTLFFEDSSRLQVPAGTELELVADGFSRVSIKNAPGWIERTALVELAAAAVPRPFARGAVDLRPFQGKNFVGVAVQADLEFHTLLDTVDIAAGECGVKVHITSSFRVKGAAVTGAIVPPAQRSNHLVGHAIDMNVLLDNVLYNSSKLQRQLLKAQPRPVVEFIGRIRAHPVLRWGGDFVKADPVHIDDDLARRNPEQWNRKFADAPG
jgi:hypothetical protein